MNQSKDLNKFKVPKSTESDIYNIIMKINTKASQGYDKIPLLRNHVRCTSSLYSGTDFI